jgi:ABC-type lipoprotein export system ATPase subunit
MMVRVENVSKSYKTAAGPAGVLKDVNVRIARGDFAMILGRSAAGKSTLLSIMGGLLRPSAGEVLIDDRPIWRMSDRDRAVLRARKIGFAFQNACVIRSLTVLENVLLGATFLHDTPADRRRARGLIETVGLGDKADAYPRQLSGGEKRRAAIASALINAPALLLADEPTGELDARTEQEVMDLLTRLHADDTTIVMVTHNAELTRYADRVFKIEDGVVYEDVCHTSSSRPSADDLKRSRQ